MNCKTFTIQNDELVIVVKKLGGTLTSVYSKKLDKELLWQGGEAWEPQDVVVFPVIGQPAFTAFGKKYQYGFNHGMARFEEFELVENSGTKLSIKLSSNERTYAEYPYNFELIVTYTLDGDTLSVDYKVISKDGSEIPYQVGGHAGFYLKNSEGVLDLNGTSKIDFYKNADGYVLEKVSTELSTIDLTKSLFNDYKTIIFGGAESNLWTVKGNDGYDIDFIPNSPIVAVWSNDTIGDYICIEPWWGLSDLSHSGKEIKDFAFANVTNTQKEVGYKVAIKVK